MFGGSLQRPPISPNRPVASADTLIEGMTSNVASAVVADRNELAKSVGYELKYLRLPEWRMDKLSVYKPQAQVALARFDFVRSDQAGDQKLSCYQARQGMIAAQDASPEKIGDKRVRLIRVEDSMALLLR